MAFSEALDAALEEGLGIPSQLVAEPLGHVVHGNLEGRVEIVHCDRGGDDGVSEISGFGEVMLDYSTGNIVAVVPGELFQFLPDGGCRAGGLREMLKVFDLCLDRPGWEWADEVVEVVEDLQKVEALPDQSLEGRHILARGRCWSGGRRSLELRVYAACSL